MELVRRARSLSLPLAAWAPEGQPAFKEWHEDICVDRQQRKEAPLGGQGDEVESLFLVFDFHRGGREGLGHAKHGPRQGSCLLCGRLREISRTPLDRH